MAKFKVLAGAALLTMAHFAPAWATPGALDAAGCHHSKKIGYHCHPERGVKLSRPAPVGAVTAEDRRLAKECKGRPNAGACLGYAR